MLRARESRSRAHRQMGVVRKEGPSVDDDGPVLCQGGEAGHVPCALQALTVLKEARKKWRGRHVWPRPTSAVQSQSL
jgi:hypothetical protein